VRDERGRQEKAGEEQLHDDKKNIDEKSERSQNVRYMKNAAKQNKLAAESRLLILAKSAEK
jgi:hypothetical protein